MSYIAPILLAYALGGQRYASLELIRHRIYGQTVNEGIDISPISAEYEKDSSSPLALGETVMCADWPELQQRR